MIRVLKLGNAIYENFEPKTLVPKAFDGSGVPTEFEERWIIPTDTNQLRNAVKDTVLWIARQEVFRKLETHGYHSVGDLKLYADRGETEAQNLLNWYLGYEISLWNWIENELPQKGFEELLEVDLYELVEGFSND